MSRWPTPPSNRYNAELRKIIEERADKPRSLNVAHRGSLFVAWWDLRPPPLKDNGTCPKYRAPDIYHDRVVGTLEEILETLIKGGILPARHTFAVTPIPVEWCPVGLAAASKENAAKHRKRTVKPPPDKGGLFAPEDVAVTGKLREGYR